MQQGPWYVQYAGAFIALGGVLIGALVNFLISLYNARRQDARDAAAHARQLERDRLTDERKLRDAMGEKRREIYREVLTVAYARLDLITDIDSRLENLREGHDPEEIDAHHIESSLKLRTLRAATQLEFGLSNALDHDLALIYESTQYTDGVLGPGQTLEEARANIDRAREKLRETLSSLIPRVSKELAEYGQPI